MSSIDARLMSPTGTIRQFLRDQNKLAEEAIALLAPGRQPLLYPALWAQVELLAEKLKALGIGRNDPVAMVLPDGLEMAVAFLAVSDVAIAAPLNPGYRAAEFDYYLADIEARAVLISGGMDSPVRGAAREQGIPAIELTTATAGTMTLAGPTHPLTAGAPSAEPDDVALLLHTGGATARPKIVPLTHFNLRHSIANTVRALQLTAADRCLNIMPQFHIHGLLAGTLASLAAGSSIVCPPAFTAPQFFEWLAEFQPTWYTAVPAMHQSILARAPYESDAPQPLRFIRSSSSPLPPPVMAELEHLFQAPVIEVYGMTEACSQIAANPLPPGRRKRGSVGLAAGPEIAIMAETGSTLRPAGQQGEIVIRGPNVTTGYRRNPEANDRSFSDGWFRTGDLGYLDEDGYLFISGRLKEVIDRSGEKISPYEIETVLLNHPLVAQAVAFAVPHPVLGEEIAAAVVLDGPGATEAELRHFVSQQLADFKTPRRILFLEAIPHGATGKVQRLGLAQKLGVTAEFLTPPSNNKGDATGSELEPVVAGLWAEVLRLPAVAANQHFLDLGGNSILAAQLIARIRQQFHVNLALIDFFDAPTVAAQAALLEQHLVTETEDSSLPKVVRQPGETIVPASFSQEHLWFLQQFDPDSTAYSIAKSYRLTGPLNVAALEQSLQQLRQRHESLRTTFRLQNGRLFQVIRSDAVAGLDVVDLRHLAEPEQEATAYRLAYEEATMPFDLGQGPLFRTRLLRLAEESYIFLCNMHHSISDGWSINIFRRDLSALYAAACEGRSAPLPALPVHYAEYTLWQRQKLQGAGLQAQLAYWKRQLNGAPQRLDLPVDRPRPPVQSYAGAYRYFALSRSLTDALDALCRQANATRFMVLATALSIVCQRYSDQDNILLGVASANRHQLPVEDLIGFFINTLVLRADLAGDPTPRQLLTRIRQTSFEAFDHQDLPFSQLVEAMRPVRDLSRHPLFQVMLVMVNYGRDEWALPEVHAEEMKVKSGTAKFDLTLYMFQEAHHDSLQCRLEYNIDLFDEATIVRLWDHLEVILTAVTAHLDRPLSELPLLTEAEQQQLLVAWNETGADYNLDDSIACLFEAQVVRTPAAPALFWQDQVIRYDELNRQANQLARLLHRQGVTPGTFVGVCLERSPELVVSLLATLKVGAVYVPLDPTYPAERLAFMLRDAQPGVVLTAARYASGLPPTTAELICLDTDQPRIAQEQDTNPPAVKADLAYLIYTSGSTGRPKGVMGRQQGIINRLAWMWQTVPFDDGECGCLKTSLNFVDSVAELFGPLLRGVPSAIFSTEQVQDPVQLVESLAHYRVTRLVLVPSLLEALLNSDLDLAAQLSALRLWVSSGETLSPQLCRRFRARLPHGRLLNLYGMSEAAADVTWYDTTHLSDTDVTVPIGRPIANTNVYILDPHRNPVPVGVTGELYIGGAGLACGYHNRPELTAERFIRSPFNDTSLLYRSGDLARYRPDGNIEYLGRRDQQVKLRGYRIELGEIEAALREHPDVGEAVVTVDGEGSEQRLVAYVTIVAAPALAAGRLRPFLQTMLPDHMLPAVIARLDSLPLMPNGKVDRRALPAPEAMAVERTAAFVAPRTAVERQLAEIWAEVLGLPRVGVEDDFFELGGHSLLAVRLLAQIKARLGQNLPLISLFRAPTIAELAQFLAREEMPAAWSSLVPLQPLGERPPFFCVHGLTGDILWFAELARQLAPHQPFYGLQARGMDEVQTPLTSIEAMAAYYLEEVRALQPEGPYFLGGASFGGMVALEMAHQLQARGQTVARLVTFDFAPGNNRSQPLWQPRLMLKFVQNLPHWITDMHRLGLARIYARARRHLRTRLAAASRWLNRSEENMTDEAAVLLDYAAELPAHRRQLIDSHARAIRRYKPQPYNGRITLIRAKIRPLLLPDSPEKGWQELAKGGLDVCVVPGSHESMFSRPHVQHLARQLSSLLRNND